MYRPKKRTSDVVVCVCGSLIPCVYLCVSVSVWVISGSWLLPFYKRHYTRYIMHYTFGWISICLSRTYTCIIIYVLSRCNQTTYWTQYCEMFRELETLLFLRASTLCAWFASSAYSCSRRIVHTRFVVNPSCEGHRLIYLP